MEEIKGGKVVTNEELMGQKEFEEYQSQMEIKKQEKIQEETVNINIGGITGLFKKENREKLANNWKSKDYQR